MIDQIANHAIKIRSYIEKYGTSEVEHFLDICLSLENLIDIHAPFIVRKNDTTEQDSPVEKVYKLKSKNYMDSFINPDEFLHQQQTALENRKKKTEKFLAAPEKDILQFLNENAPLKKWQRDILGMLREEVYYFAPQAQTKIMNEGWATYWHSKIMTTSVLSDADIIDYADHHAGTLSTSGSRLNPYKIGVELFRDIEDRWNRGAYGKEYDECDDFREKKNWNKALGKGREKIFEVRKFDNNLTFIDTYLTAEFCQQQKLFNYQYNELENQYQISNRQFKQIKRNLLNQLTNSGQPHIYIEDADYSHRKELYLLHRHEGVDLKIDEAHDTLKNIYAIWRRPVHLETVIDDVKSVLGFDGEDSFQHELIE